MKQKLVIVDGNSLINRAYFAMSDLKNSKGIYTGGVHGLTSMVFSLIDQFKPTHFCVAFDMKGPTFRHLTYESYKGTRKGMPDELAMQMPIVKEILDVLNIPRVELQGYEADDLIGTFARRALESQIEVHVITGDKDALQLVALGAFVHITKKGITNLKCYEDSDVYEELGVHAEQVIDYKGLSGDSSDNIPGIPSIGPKTAAKLLEQFGTVESLITSVDQVENKRIKGLVVEYAEQALLSKRLATIHTEVPVDLALEDLCLKEPDYDNAILAFRKYELNSLLGKLKGQSAEVAKPTIEHRGTDHVMVSGTDIIKKIKETGVFTFKFLCDYDGINRRNIVAAAFLIDSSAYVLEDIREIVQFREVFESAEIKKFGYEVKNEYLSLMALGIDLNGVVFDGFIAAYLLEPSRRNYDLSELAFEHLSLKMISEDELLGKGVKRVTYSALELTKCHAFLLETLNSIFRLNELFSAQMDQQQLTPLFEQVEVPLVKILADIEFTGFRVNEDEINHIDAQLVEKIEEIEKSIYTSAGEAFNINSPKQLGVILFEKLGLPSGKKTKTGYSTGHDVLEKLAHKHPIVDEIIEYRMLTKLKSTYIDGLRAVIDPSTKRVHTSLNQTIAVTGRLSSTEPNLQNIPIRLPYGRKIRKFFIADEGCVLLDADYSQIELRVLAHLSEDPMLINAFNNDIDIHTLTASQVFHIPKEEVTSLQRSRAKEVNFGIVYGMGDFGLSESLDISRKDAKLYIENYFESYPNVRGFMDDIIDKCKVDGYVTTVLGRKRMIPEINHSNFMLRSAAERIARNTPIQGSAADIIKLAMIKVYDALNNHHLKTKLILQVHDELILNVPLDELETVKSLLKDSMEEAFALSVPLKVDMNTGGSWYDAK